MITQQQLIDLGFTEKESRVYLALLELGPSTATQIARKAGINRTTGYDILDGLAAEKLVSTPGETKIQKFAAEHPKKMVAFLEKKIQRAQERLAQATGLVPELLSMFNTKAKPRVRYYEGADGVREAFEDTLTATETIRAYAVGEDMFEVLTEAYFKNYFQKRVKRNIKVRLIAPDTEQSRAVCAHDAEEMRQTLLVPKDKFYFSVETNIYNNKIMIASWRERFAVLLESEEIADAQKKTFELAWEGAKHLAVWSSVTENEPGLPTENMPKPGTKKLTRKQRRFT